MFLNKLKSTKLCLFEGNFFFSKTYFFFFSQVITIVEGQNYTPLKDITIGGIIMMQCTGKTDQDLVEPVAAYGPKNEDAKEPDAPEPFEYSDD